MIRVESSHILCLVSASQHTQQLPSPLLSSHTEPDPVLKPFVLFDALGVGIISHIKKAPRGCRHAKTHLVAQREKAIFKHHFPLLADASSPNSSSITLSGLCRSCLWLWLSSLAQENTVPGYFPTLHLFPPLSPNAWNICRWQQGSKRRGITVAVSTARRHGPHVNKRETEQKA